MPSEENQSAVHILRFQIVFSLFEKTNKHSFCLKKEWTVDNHTVRHHNSCQK